MPLCVLLPTERVNRLYHAMLWCLGAGNESHTQINVTFALSGLVHPHSDAVCNLCQAGHASVCPLANRESEQTAPRDALLFGSWQCNTYTAICYFKRFALSGLVHPHRYACVQTVLPRSCIYVSPCLLRGRTGCTMRCFGAWELAMHHARRGSSSSLRG